MIRSIPNVGVRGGLRPRLTGPRPNDGTAAVNMSSSPMKNPANAHYWPALKAVNTIVKHGSKLVKLVNTLHESLDNNWEKQKIKQRLET